MARQRHAYKTCPTIGKRRDLIRLPSLLENAFVWWSIRAGRVRFGAGPDQARERTGRGNFPTA